MKRGKLVVFEGISGTGKETQAKLLKAYLAEKHISARIVFHPTTEVKPILRQQKTADDQLRVLAHDRESVVQKVIIPALTRGEWVISLRNFMSAYVYQGNGKSVQDVDLAPDYLFYFDLDPEIAMNRIEKRNEERGAYEKITLLRDKRERYRKIVKAVPHVTVDAAKSVDMVHKNVIKYIRI